MSDVEKKMTVEDKAKMSVDIRIRKVKVLQGRAKKEAEKKGLKPDDLVIVTTSVDPLPEYHIEKIDEDPVSYLLNRDKFVVVEREKLRELADLLKNRPKRMHGNMDRAMYSTREVNEWFEDFEKKFAELLKAKKFTRVKASVELKDIARELGLKPKKISLKKDVLTPLGKNLFARKTEDKGIEIFEVVGKVIENENFV